jgi:hypothetical protein
VRSAEYSVESRLIELPARLVGARTNRRVTRMAGCVAGDEYGPPQSRLSLKTFGVIGLLDASNGDQCQYHSPTPRHQPSAIAHRTPPLAGFPLPARRRCAVTKRIRRRPHEKVRRPSKTCRWRRSLRPCLMWLSMQPAMANLVSASNSPAFKYPGWPTTPRPFHPPWEENNK